MARLILVVNRLDGDIRNRLICCLFVFEGEDTTRAIEPSSSSFSATDEPDATDSEKLLRLEFVCEFAKLALDDCLLSLAPGSFAF